MPRADRYARMTAEQKEAKLERQRRHRLTKPSVNGRMKSVLGRRNYFELYQTLLKYQKGVCAICKKPPGARRLHIDHDHQTLEVRGLLCFSCNNKLGFVEKYLDEIAEYLG